MKKLNSIQTSDKIFETGGSRPVLITCNDFEEYVCKYNIGYGPSLRLACEYIAASFLKLWNLNVPDFALVKISREHIPPEYKIRDAYFNVTCFGSKYSRSFAEVTKFSDLITPQNRKTYVNRKDIYYISLFDIWLANEDRNHNNYNLLVDVNNQHNFIPIDHECIFNTRIINQPITSLSYQDSLISTPLTKKIFAINELIKTDKEEIRSNLYTFVNQCRVNLVNIINELPDDWKINKKNWNPR